MSSGDSFALGYAIIGRLLHRLHWMMQLPSTIVDELLPAMPLIADQVSALVPNSFPLLVQQQDAIPDLFTTISFLDAKCHHRAEFHSGENPTTAFPFEAPV
jgi:hypothetical protein